MVVLLIILSIISFKIINVEDVHLVDDNNIDTMDEVENQNRIEEDIVVQPTTVDIDLLAVGDIMFHMPQIKSAKIGVEEYDFTHMFKYVKEYIQDADIALGNYETVAVKDRAYSGFPRFNSPIETIKALKDTGFDILSTANNHSLDQGKTGIISTIEAIKEQGLKSVGTNLDKDLKPLIVDVQGIRVGVLSYTFGLNGLDSLLTGVELSYMVNLIDEEKIQEEIRLMKNDNVDIILAYIHWGHEYHREPSQYQKELGEKLVQWGIHIVLGSHPHVVQKSEIIESHGKDHLIVYSMGNFLSNQREITMGNPYTEDGVMVRINIKKDLTLNETVIKKIEYIPTWVYRYNDGGNYFYEILPTEDVMNGRLDLNLDSSTKYRIEKSHYDTINVYREE